MESRRLGKIGAASEADVGFDSPVKRTVDRPRDRNDGCSYKTLFNSVCSLDRDETTGKAVQICEKTEKLLRRCPGRPEEIVESRTEKMIEDASTSSSGYLLDRDARKNHGFHQPQVQDRFGLERGGEESLLQDFFDRKREVYAGPLDELVQAAEDIVRDVFGPFGMAEAVPPRHPSDAKVEHPSGWFWGAILGRDRNEKPSCDQSNSRQEQESQKLVDSTGLAQKIREI